MKHIELYLTCLFSAFVIIVSISSGQAFHSGGTGDCQGCHSMHNVKGGQKGSVMGGGSQSNPFLLKGPDPSSTCLACHMTPAGTGQSTGHYVCTNEADMPSGMPPSQLTPGGDFGWLKKNYVWGLGSSSRGDSLGERHGHNIVASSFSFMADTRNTFAPQGIYPSDQLSCISCHDPHGKYRRFVGGTVATGGQPVIASGSYSQSPDPDSQTAVGVYRMLAGKGYQPKYMSGGFAFVSDPPAAVAPASYNREELSADTRVAYGRGMSEWCENCHSTSHQAGSGEVRHPAGNLKKLSSDVIKHYHSYIASGNNTGNAATSYSSIVPFEMGTNDYLILKKSSNSDGSDRSGPEPGKGSANVMCLSCHRAHASGWDNMTRWNMKAEFLVYKGVYPGIDNSSPPEMAQGRNSLEVKKAFYGRLSTQYAVYQRSLCNKCHAKD
jgi:hypothetical protein